MPDHRKLLLICVLVFTALLFVNYFFISEYFEEYIPGLPVNVNIQGLFLVAVLWVMFYIVFKWMVKQYDSVSVAYLTIFGGLIVLFSELIFQTYRISISEMTNTERLRSFLIGVFGMSAFAALFSFTTAIDIKVKNRLLSWVINVSIFALFYFAGPYILSFIKGE